MPRPKLANAVELLLAFSFVVGIVVGLAFLVSIFVISAIDAASAAERKPSQVIHGAKP